jgi:hypothetical protein
MATAVTVTVESVDYVFTPDSVRQDVALYLGPGSTLSLPHVMSTRRVYPKRQKTYPGNARNILKTTRSFSYDDGTTAPIIWETSVSRRADSDEADFTLMRDIHASLIMDAELDGYFNNLSL